MYQIRIHGRGGQGVVTAAEMLSVAAFTEGHWAQAFPSFGSERTGAPVVAFARIDEKEIRLREPIQEPDVVLVQDRTLLESEDVFGGIRPDGYVLINSSSTPEELGLGELIARLPKGHVQTVPATRFAIENIGRPLPGCRHARGLCRHDGGDYARERTGGLQRAFRRQNCRSQRQGRAGGLGSRQSPIEGSGGKLMLKQIEGSQGVAQAVALCRPEVICAYPISPQTHIVEALGTMTRKGLIPNCEYINVESEFAAMSVAIGASVGGARAYTATASQGLLYMVEAVYNASGLGLPIVMTVANRAIGAPINIWNDHSDSMSQRDSGWIQIFAETNQEAADLHIQAFRIAEELSLPVMVCMDGFVLTHAFERIDIPSQEDVDKFLPPYSPRQELDPSDPISIGAMVGPEAFTEVRYLAHVKQRQALELIPQVAAEFKEVFGRSSGGLVHTYRCEDADIRIVAMGSCLGTIKDAVDELREETDLKIGVVGVKCFRPFPVEVMGEALEGAKTVVVLERTLAVGSGGVLSRDIMVSIKDPSVTRYTVIAGLGGRAITKASLKKMLKEAAAHQLETLTFMDLNKELVERQLERERKTRKSGPVPEALIRDAAMHQ